ncbi:hypothetical protein [Gramella sp. MAR_2010_147]|uniref:hypothetical protein n=1 Tax=Gramella sp. MAR_2010_147 TaxID=1250205 RepID=UPI00087B7553|nr:hypothetical protein [Gramella sp. MAR_2010_147]SDS30710.1 hypothetical protein SAMN04488553_1957 [Gramella sp. MAR_2010_147]
MKFIFTIMASLFLLVQNGCNSDNANDEEQYTGIIKPAGITTYQYGTHRLETQQKVYALKSDKINLENYEDQEVEITATLIEGYPVDGGPVYLLVTKVNK